MRCLWLWIGALGWLGCGSPAPGDDAGAGDGAVDASAVDASAADGSAADAGAADGSATLDAGPDGGTPSGLTLPPPNAPFDYQLGGAYPPPEGVMVVSRDRTDPPAAGLYNICYVNGFQVQPNEEDFWLEEEPDLILRDGSGDPVVDDGWDEMLIDVGTPEKRGRVAVIVGEWITGCADAGYDAVEIDNLDSFSRSRGLLDEDDAVAMMALFSATAHAYGLAIAQKNSAELVGRRAEMGTDFVVAEECNRWDECDVYTGVYGDDVLVVEYRRSDFEAGCADFPQLSIVLRDLELVTPGSAGYVYDGCWSDRAGSGTAATRAEPRQHRGAMARAEKRSGRSWPRSRSPAGRSGRRLRGGASGVVGGKWAMDELTQARWISVQHEPRAFVAGGP